MPDISTKDTNSANIAEQETKIKRQSKVLLNCNADATPETYPAPLEDLYYYLKDKIVVFVNGDGKAIEYTNKVDLNYYCEMWRWDTTTAIALSLGQSPWKITKLWHRFAREFRQEYEQRTALLKEAIKYKHIPYDAELYMSCKLFPRVRNVVRPLNFVKWAKEKNWEFFFDIEELVRKYDKAGHMDFEARCKDLEKEIIQLRQEMHIKTRMGANPLGARREESLHKLIAGLALLKFPHLPAINASNIANHLAELDLPFDMISEDTIRALLEPSRKLLGVESKSTKNKK